MRSLGTHSTLSTPRRAGIPGTLGHLGSVGTLGGLGSLSTPGTSGQAGLPSLGTPGWDGSMPGTPGPLAAWAPLPGSQPCRSFPGSAPWVADWCTGLPGQWHPRKARDNMSEGLDHQRVPKCFLVNESFALASFLCAPEMSQCAWDCQSCLEEGRGYLGLLVQLTWLF